MIIGIDVGGTHTDGVLIRQANGIEFGIAATAKVPTDRNQLMNSIITILDQLTAGKDNQQITRVVLSTTLATNTILEEKYDPVGLVLIPGPGLNPEYLKYGEENIILSGYINHRGQEVEPLNQEEIIKGLDKFTSRDIHNLAVVGKFSIRNPGQEQEVISIIKEGDYSFPYLSSGHQLSGRLNFPRRIVTAYYNSAITPVHRIFVQAVQKALKARNIQAEVFLLKCDGGTIPLQQSVAVPIETVNSGPAASIMGIMTLSQVSQQKETAVALDIGGTTTDIGLFIDGEPVFMPEGIAVKGLPTLVRGLYSVSIPVGGDSGITVEEGCLRIGPQRLGSAAALGGPVPTPTDALLVAGYLEDDQDYGGNFDREAAQQALSLLSSRIDLTRYREYLDSSSIDHGDLDLRTTAEIIIGEMTAVIINTIRGIIDKLQNQPVYTISELLANPEIKPALLLGMGGPAGALLPLLAGKMGYRGELVPAARVANAVGAASARPTLTTTVRVDTAAGYLNIVEAGIHRKLKRADHFDITQAGELAVDWTRKRAADQQAEVEITDSESFNVIRGFSTLGQIMEVKAQIKPGPTALIKRSEGKR